MINCSYRAYSCTCVLSASLQIKLISYCEAKEVVVVSHCTYAAVYTSISKQTFANTRFKTDRNGEEEIQIKK